MEGQLVNGSHRLSALIVHGKPQQFPIIRGLIPEEIGALDIGAKRTGGDLFAFRGEANAQLLASMFPLLAIWERSQTIGIAKGHNLWVPLTPPDMVARFDEDADTLRLAARVATARKKEIPLPPSLIGLLYYLFHQVSEQAAGAFFESLASGANLGTGDPILVLRNRLFAPTSTRRGLSTGERSRRVLGALVIKTWNAWRQGRLISRILWYNNEAFPSIYGLPKPAIKSA